MLLCLKMTSGELRVVGTALRPTAVRLQDRLLLAELLILLCPCRTLQPLQSYRTLQLSGRSQLLWHALYTALFNPGRSLDMGFQNQILPFQEPFSASQSARSFLQNPTGLQKPKAKPRLRTIMAWLCKCWTKEVLTRVVHEIVCIAPSKLLYMILWI